MLNKFTHTVYRCKSDLLISDKEIIAACENLIDNPAIMPSTKYQNCISNCVLRMTGTITNFKVNCLPVDTILNMLE